MVYQRNMLLYNSLGLYNYNSFSFYNTIFKMTRIAIGYLFSIDRQYIALINQKFTKDNIHIFEDGIYLNGLGGHIELGETSQEAIQREFLEEGGLNIKDWKQFTTLYKPGIQVDFFKAFSDEVFDVKTIEDEIVCVYNIAQLQYLQCHPNLQALTLLALDNNLFCATLVY